MLHFKSLKHAPIKDLDCACIICRIACLIRGPYVRSDAPSPAAKDLRAAAAAAIERTNGVGWLEATLGPAPGIGLNLFVATIMCVVGPGNGLATDARHIGHSNRLAKLAVQQASHTV